jgi:hypothetical protein
MHALLRTALTVTLAGSVGGCGGPATDPLPPPPPPQETCPIPTVLANVTFSGQVLPMLRSSCGANSALSCHGAPPPAKGHVSWAPSLSATEVWSQLVGVPPSNAPTGAGWLRVAAGDVAHSWLIEKVTRDDPGGAGQAYGNRMPFSLPNLCTPTVETLKNWISAGARND